MHCKGFVFLFVVLMMAVNKVSSQTIGCPGQQIFCGCVRRCSDGNFDEIAECQGSCVTNCCQFPEFLSRSGVCVSISACLAENAGTFTLPGPGIPFPSVTEGTSIRVVCNGNRIFSTQARCDVFCGERFNIPPCNLPPREDCICPSGFFADDNTGVCVSPSSCPIGPIPPTTTNTFIPPTTIPTIPPIAITDPFVFEGDGSCSDPEVSATCDRCERTCASRLLNIRCFDDPCPPTCRCPDGQLRFDGRCVFVDECPLEGVSNAFCGGECPSGQTCQAGPNGFACASQITSSFGI